MQRLASHPARGAWIEIEYIGGNGVTLIESHPARGAWIEIIPVILPQQAIVVAPRKGCVD